MLAAYIAVISVLLLAGCSPKKIAINKLGNALARSGTTFSSDDDPELVEAALPFSLKLIESLLAESPRHRGLLQAAASGFTQYSYAFVSLKADMVEEDDYELAEHLRGRAKRLYRRARDYGLRGLETKLPNLSQGLRNDPVGSLTDAKERDVALLYWTASAWGLMISLSKDDPETVADQPVVEALIDRALALDESFDHGAIHSFLITYEPSRVGVAGEAAERSREHFRRAVELSGGAQAGPYVSLAEAVSLQEQNRKEFEELMRKALAVDVNARPEFRLANLVAQQRARWQLGRIEDLFLE